MQKILVTGANSFVGKYLIPFLASKGHEVRGIVRKQKGNEHIGKFGLSYGFVRPPLVGDLSEINFLYRLNWRPDVIIHLAANRDDSSRISKIFNDNIAAVANLTLFSRNTECSKIIFLSSVSVHGTIYTSELSHNTGYMNPSLYGFTKRVGEILLQENISNQATYILRLPSIIGYGAQNHWLSRTLENALSNTSISIQNSDSKFNNTIYIEDLLFFIDCLLNRTEKGVFTFPIASTEPITINKVVDLIIKESGSKSTVKKISSNRSAFVIDDIFARENFAYSSRTTSLAVANYVQDEVLKI